MLTLESGDLESAAAGDCSPTAFGPWIDCSWAALSRRSPSARALARRHHLLGLDPLGRLAVEVRPWRPARSRSSGALGEGLERRFLSLARMSASLVWIASRLAAWRLLLERP